MKTNPNLRLLFVLCSLLCYQTLFPQQLPQITTSDIPDLTITRNDTFDGKSLWGYMNGGADIYLEYGFDVLRVQEFELDDEYYKLELFKMNEAVSAFGIFSYKSYRCDSSDIITTPDCINRFQYQLSYGDYYIQIISDNASQKTRDVMVSVASILLEKIEYEESVLPIKFLMDEFDFPIYDITMVKGELGILTHALFVGYYLEDIEGFQVYIAEKIKDDKKLRYYEIVFEDTVSKKSFTEKYMNEGFIIGRDSGNSVLIITE